MKMLFLTISFIITTLLAPQFLYNIEHCSDEKECFECCDEMSKKDKQCSNCNLTNTKSYSGFGYSYFFQKVRVSYIKSKNISLSGLSILPSLEPPNS